MSLNSLLLLMPYRTYLQITLVYPECQLCLSQLNIRLPQFLCAEVIHIASQQVTALRQLRPVSPRLDLLPNKFCTAIGSLNNIRFKQTGRSTVFAEQSAQSLCNGYRLVLACGTACFYCLQTFFNTVFQIVRVSPSLSGDARCCGKV